MLHSSVGELVDWVYDTTDDYDMAMSLSKYLMSQGEFTIEDVKEHYDILTDSGN